MGEHKHKVLHILLLHELADKPLLDVTCLFLLAYFEHTAEIVQFIVLVLAQVDQHIFRLMLHLAELVCN